MSRLLFIISILSFTFVGCGKFNTASFSNMQSKSVVTQTEEAHISVSGLKYLYYGVSNNSSNDKVFTITNDSNVDAVGITPLTPGLVFPSGTCTPVLRAGESCTMSARFVSSSALIFGNTVAFKYVSGSKIVKAETSPSYSTLDVLVQSGKVYVLCREIDFDFTNMGGYVVFGPRGYTQTDCY